jgi:hypothetical protein
MQVKFKLIPGTAIDGIVKSLQESTTDPIIDIHIERGEVEVKSRPSFYLSPDVAMREFKEGMLASDRIVMLPVSQSGGGCREPNYLTVRAPEKMYRWLRSFFKPKRKHANPEFGGFLKRSVFSDAYLEKCDDAPYAGCDCDLCEAIRKYRGFGL